MIQFDSEKIVKRAQKMYGTVDIILHILYVKHTKDLLCLNSRGSQLNKWKPNELKHGKNNI